MPNCSRTGCWPRYSSRRLGRIDASMASSSRLAPAAMMRSSLMPNMVARYWPSAERTGWQSNLDLRAQFHQAVAGDAEEVRRRGRVAVHHREELVAPHGHAAVG